MPEARANPEDEEPEEELESDLESLKLRGDVDALLELAKAYRSGRRGVTRDLKRCFEVYKAAAELGSAEGEYAVALFNLTGGVVPQDLKEGTTRLRAAAEKGSVPAKVYLGNLYELGIHYKQDKEKADVWYRNAARGAQVDSEQGTDDYRQELAELGCVRHFLELSQENKLDEADKTRLLQRVKAHGYQLRIKGEGSNPSVLPTEPTGDRPTLQAALDANEIPAKLSDKIRLASTPPPPPQVAKDSKEAKDAAAETVKIKSLGPTQTSIALGAFGYALLFVLAGTGAGYAATHGARELLEHGTKLPGLGTHTEYVFPIVLFLFGLYPAGVAYKMGAWLKALIAGAALGGVGWVAWGTGMAALHASRFYQSIAFGLVGFLAALLVLGLWGGTKKQPPRAPRKKI
ncbi:MAG: tetratricopeptide repeat protein [Labilithrix sp.]